MSNVRQLFLCVRVGVEWVALSPFRLVFIYRIAKKKRKKSIMKIEADRYQQETMKVYEYVGGGDER